MLTLQECFKPYYNWITFNTEGSSWVYKVPFRGFKPYYNWITFNTEPLEVLNDKYKWYVLILIITG